MFLYCVLCKSLKKEPLIGILKYYYLCIFEFCEQAEDIDLSFSYVVYLNLYEASENFSYLNQFSYKIFDKAKKHFKNNDFFYFSLVFQKISLSVKEKLYSKNRFKANDIYYLYTERDHLKINEIFFKFSSFRQPLTINYFYKFLAQFGTLDRVRAVLKILDKIDFFDFWQLNELMEKIILNNCVFDKGEIYICPLEADGSSQFYQYLISHSQLIKDKFGNRVKYKNSLQEVLNTVSKNDNILIMDDCTISGTQTKHIIEELLGIRKSESHHTVHCAALNKNDIKKLKNTMLNFCFCLGSQYAEHIIKNVLHDADFKKFKINIGKNINYKNKIFSHGATIWESIEEREDLKTFCQKVGYGVLEQIELTKKWPRGRRETSSLGYSDFQLLIVFPYSVPKTTLTFLWCEGNNWKPLFPNV
ncbi:hypothetical protein D9M71_19950 [compost metagenome]